MYPVDDMGNTGWSMCNLSEINVAKTKTKEEFFEACKAAAVLGTLQAGYTYFPYLTPATQRIVEREALLGVSLTGMMSNPDIAFNPEIQREGARIIRETNEEVARVLGINPAARLTCVKPSGTASVLLGTSSGIHPEHARKYIRHMQANKLEEPIKFFKKYNPVAVEEGYKDTDYCLSFVINVPKSARIKSDVKAIDLLESVRLTKLNWIDTGKVEERCVKPYLSHNVSNTIHVKDNEWEEVFEYIWEHKSEFAGITLFSEFGDKDYYQAPNTTVHSAKEIINMYGEAALFVGGLNVHALKIFKHIWEASDFLLYDMKAPDTDKIEELQHFSDKMIWKKRAIKFAENYFNGDLKKLTYCMKDVTILKKSIRLEREFKEVPWDEFFEEENNTKAAETIACSGGSCEITTI
jgi:ribonucleoside-diphosphate reductase alpha chain